MCLTGVAIVLGRHSHTVRLAHIALNPRLTSVLLKLQPRRRQLDRKSWTKSSTMAAAPPRTCHRELFPDFPRAPYLLLWRVIACDNGEIPYGKAPLHFFQCKDFCTLFTFLKTNYRKLALHAFSAEGAARQEARLRDQLGHAGAEKWLTWKVPDSVVTEAELADWTRQATALTDGYFVHISQHTQFDITEVELPVGHEENGTGDEASCGRSEAIASKAAGTPSPIPIWLLINSPVENRYGHVSSCDTQAAYYFVRANFTGADAVMHAVRYCQNMLPKPKAQLQHQLSSSNYYAERWEPPSSTLLPEQTEVQGGSGGGSN
jgi:hypothetical protein